MLIQMLVNQPQMLGPIIKNTPLWVGGLLAALTWLGLSQARNRTASLARVTFMPLTMTGLSLWGTFSAFGDSPMFGYVMLAWMFAATVMLAIVAPLSAPSGTVYDATSRSYAMPGSVIPMVLILGIFLTKYVVAVELAMQPSLARDGQYTLVVGALYGVFSGIFTGRAAGLLRLALRPAGPPRIQAFNT
ncbi:MAG: DUF6622 family protein [Ramlibacter sp.]